MSYLTQSRLAADQTLMIRITACAVMEGIENPQAWAFEHAWQLSAEAGWVAAYASAAVAHAADPAGTPPPGENESAITDQMILAAVQAIRTTEAPAE